MATLHASDVSGGSHHDALLVLRSPFLKDKYTVEYIWLGACTRARSDNELPLGPRNVAQQRPRLTPLVPHLLAALQEATTVTCEVRPRP